MIALTLYIENSFEQVQINYSYYPYNVRVIFINSLQVLKRKQNAPIFFSPYVTKLSNIKPLIQPLLNKEDVPLLQKWNPILHNPNAREHFYTLNCYTSHHGLQDYKPKLAHNPTKICNLFKVPSRCLANGHTQGRNS